MYISIESSRTYKEGRRGSGQLETRMKCLSYYIKTSLSGYIGKRKIYYITIVYW